jgi:hypothetical protein
VLSLVVLVLVGCGTNHHITVPPLPPQPTPEQRLDIWQHWHSRAHATETVTTCNRVSCRSEDHAIVQLEGGVEVRHVEDVLPLVPADSNTARAANEVLRLRAKRSKYNWLMAIGSVVGATVAIVGAREDSMAVGFSGVGVLAGSLVVGAIGKYFVDEDIDVVTKRGFDSYDQDLAHRLQVCVRGMAVVPCEMDTPGTMSVPLEQQDNVLQGLPQR